MKIFNSLCAMLTGIGSIVALTTKDYCICLSFGLALALFLYQALFKNKFNMFVSSKVFLLLLTTRIISIAVCLALNTERFYLGWIDGFLGMFIFQVLLDYHIFQ